MLTLYAKNVADSISAKVLKQIKDAIDRLRAGWLVSLVGSTDVLTL